jgi:hypothetical protein
MTMPARGSWRSAVRRRRTGSGFFAGGRYPRRSTRRHTGPDGGTRGDPTGSRRKLALHRGGQSKFPCDRPRAGGERHSKYPVVLFFHSFGVIHFAYTVLIEDLVGHGYVVASIAHTYRVSAIAFPDGRVFRLAQRNEVWAADMRFAIDRLTAWNGAPDNSLLAGRLNLASLGAFGHSVGGRAAVRACQPDSRIKACVNEGGASPEEAFLNYPGGKLRLSRFCLFSRGTGSWRKPPARGTGSFGNARQELPPDTERRGSST